MRSPYQVLGVKRGASPTEIKTAYRARAKKLHPDHGGNEAAFKELAAAYAILGDPIKRMEYDTVPRSRASKPGTSRPATAAHRTPTAQSNPHPGSSPLNPTEQAAFVQGLRAVGLSLMFGAAFDLTPPGETRDTLRKARDKADSALDSFLDSFLGGTR